jgi:hypothetical protein
MDKKILIVGQSQVEKMSALVEAQAAWDRIEMVIVRDEDFERACTHLRANLPPGKRMLELRELVEPADGAG